VTLAPWDYLWLPFSRTLFPDIYDATWISSLVLLVVLIVLYNVRTRALHRHRPFADLWEWLLWTGLIGFFLIAIGALFLFDFAVVLILIVATVATMLWVRFRRFPPLVDAYEHQLARQRYLTRAKAARPEATIRSKSSRRRRR
jgi:hypothetical protein